MTTKTINTYIAAGYTLSPAFNRLVITTTGGIGGTGLYAGSYAKIINDGVVHGEGASNGILLQAGGFIRNGDTTVTGALIEGFRGIDVQGGFGTVANFGTIDALGRYNYAISLFNGGSVLNGTTLDTGALIEGYRGIDVEYGIGSVTNYGTIDGSGKYTNGVNMSGGGSLTNGAAGHQTALIEGGYGVVIDAGGALAATLTNLGPSREPEAPRCSSIHLRMFSLSKPGRPSWVRFWGAAEPSPWPPARAGSPACWPTGA